MLLFEGQQPRLTKIMVGVNIAGAEVNIHEGAADNG